jgi:hypothetical protein
MRLLAATTAVLLVGFASSAWATPISASVALDAVVNLDGNGASDPQSASWGTLLSPLNVLSSVSQNGPNGGSIAAQGAIDATWGAGGNSGSVAFTRYGWSAVSGGSSYAASLDTAGADWTYSFTADADGTFAMSYDVTGSGSTFGLWGWNIDWSGPGGGLHLINPLDPTASGAFSRSIVAGQTYTIDLHNNANISGGAFGTGEMNGLFKFSVTGVPEPATLLLMGAGLIGFGRIRRKR